MSAVASLHTLSTLQHAAVRAGISLLGVRLESGQWLLIAVLRGYCTLYLISYLSCVTLLFFRFSGFTEGRGGRAHLASL